jgi:hypothetical protein
MTNLLATGRCIIRATGEIEPLPGLKLPLDTFRPLQGLVTYPYFEIVRLHRELDGSPFQPPRIMLCDEEGLLKPGQQRNALATRLYHAQCRQGTTSPIMGDVIILHATDLL